MKNSSQSLDALVENYIYSIADKFIDLANPENQTKFISLIYRIDSSATEKNAINSTTRSLVDRPSDMENEPPVEPYTVGLEIQWQASLNKGVRRMHKDARIKQIERLISIHQTTIELTYSHIYRLAQLLDRAENNLSTTHRKRIIATYFQSIKNYYGTYLAKIQALQQKEINKLQEDE